MESKKVDITMSDYGHFYIDGFHVATIGNIGIVWVSESISKIELLAIIEHLSILHYGY